MLENKVVGISELKKVELKILDSMANLNPSLRQILPFTYRNTISLAKGSHKFCSQNTILTE